MIDLIALDDVIASYDVKNDAVFASFKPIFDQIWNDIEAYGAGLNDYGLQMAGHLNRISVDGANFLKKVGFSVAVQRNFDAAFRLSDLGKLHPAYNVEDWTLDRRPTADEKDERRLHTERGVEILERYIKDLPEDVKSHPHITTVIPALMMYHHERLDGQGQFGLKADQLGTVVRVSCIVDAYDGDRIARPHQPAMRTEVEALRRMMSLDGHDKYDGAFDENLLMQYVRMKEEELGIEII